MLKNKVEAAFFDMDGTLLDTLDDICDSIRDTLSDWKLPLKSNEELLKYIGWGAKFLCQGATGFEDGEALDRFHREYRAHTLTRDDPKTVPYNGMREVVRSLHARGMRVAILTNKPQKWTEKLAALYFDDGVFDEIYGVKEGGFIKPEPGAIFEICERWGISPQNVVMIGDSPVDIETAHNAGCPGIGCTWGFRSREMLEQAGADELVDDADELMDLFKADV